MMSDYTVRAVEVGYGTTSFVAKVENGMPIIKTFSSVAAPVNAGSNGSGGLSRRNTVKVQVDQTTLEVGPDAHLLYGRNSSRVTNNGYIGTAQYKALYDGCHRRELPALIRRI